MSADRIHDSDHAVVRNHACLRLHAIIGALAENQVVVLLVQAVLHDRSRHETELVGNH